VEHFAHGFHQAFLLIGADNDVAAESQLCVGDGTVQCLPPMCENVNVHSVSHSSGYLTMVGNVKVLLRMTDQLAKSTTIT